MVGDRCTDPAEGDAVASSRPRCLTVGCAFEGQADAFGYCIACAERLGLFPPAPSPLHFEAAPTTVLGHDTVYPTATSHNCRAGCGFFGSPERCGLCSSCFSRISDDWFHVALAGCIANRREAVSRYIAAGGDPLRTISEADVTALMPLNIHVTAGHNLVRTANTYDSIDVVLYLVDLDSSPVGDNCRRKTLSSLLAFGVAETEEAAMMEDNVRLELISTQQARSDGLVYYDTGLTSQQLSLPVELLPLGKCFALPRSLRNLMHGNEVDEPLRKYQEQGTMVDDISAATSFFSTIPGCDVLFPLYTQADLNCLLHAAFTAMVGVSDGILASDAPDSSSATTRTVLRDSMRNSLLVCRELQAAVAPRHRDDPACVEFDLRRLEQLQHDIEQGKASLDGGHVFALANVLRRPIIVWADIRLESSFRATLSVPFRVSGVYLPLLWDPADTVRDPLYMCYSSGHFSALVGFLDDDSTTANAVSGRVVAPLCDEQFVPLPLHFTDSPNVAELLRSRGLPSTTVVPAVAPKLAHTTEELQLLSVYTRIAGTVPLVEDAVELEAVPQISLIYQCCIRPSSLEGEGQSSTNLTQTEMYLGRIWRALRSMGSPAARPT